MGLDLGAVRAGLTEQGYQLGEFEVVCSKLGYSTARTRRVLLGLQASSGVALDDLSGPVPVRHVQGVRHMLLPEGPSNPCCWADEAGTVIWDPRMATTGDPFLPKPVGTLQEGDKRRV